MVILLIHICRRETNKLINWNKTKLCCARPCLLYSIAIIVFLVKAFYWNVSSVVFFQQPFVVMNLIGYMRHFKFQIKPKTTFHSLFFKIYSQHFFSWSKFCYYAILVLHYSTNRLSFSRQSFSNKRWIILIKVFSIFI